MKKILSVSIFFAILFSVSDNAFAQKFTKRKRYISAGMSVGTGNYVGDLDPGNSFISPSFRNTGPAVGLFAGMYRWKPRMSFRGSFTYTFLSGNDFKSSTGNTPDDKWRRIRNLNFYAHLVETKVDMIYDLYANKGTYLKRPDFAPYAFTGLAFIYCDPVTRLPDGKGGYIKGSAKRVSTLDLETKSFSPLHVVIPMGIGVRKKVNKLWDFSFEVGWRWSFTDYLDGVSSDYNQNIKPENLKYQNMTWSQDSKEYAYAHGYNESMYYPDAQGNLIYNIYGDGTGVKDTKRGKLGKDWYIMTSLQVTKIFKGGVRCPKFR